MQVAIMDARLNAGPLPRRVLAWLRAHRRAIIFAAILVFAALGFAMLRSALHEVRLRDVRHALRLVAPEQLAGAALLTAASYLALTIYDFIALRVIGRPLPWRTAALASFTGYAISNSLGLSLLTGGSARYRVYAAAGLEAGDVARVTLLASATFWLGLFSVGGAALLFAPPALASLPWVGNVVLLHYLGGAILAGIAALILARATVLRGREASIASLPLPPASALVAQLCVSGVDLLAAAGALYLLIPGGPQLGFGGFFVIYAVAIVIAIVTHVPGGIGVFEAVMLAAIPAGRSEVFVGLLLYRLIYYLLPLSLAAAGIAVGEAYRVRHHLAPGFNLVGRVTRSLAPEAMALLVFAGGLLLLVSGALPAVHSRIFGLRSILPLPFVESSHFLASLSGTALLLVAPALAARLRSGFHAARLILIAGMVFSLLKGFDYEEATLLFVVVAILQYARPAFYRRAGLFDAPFARTWFAAAAIAVALSMWAGFFAYKHIPYSNELWWDFAWRGNAPRFLRSSAGAIVLLGAVAWWRLIWAPVRPKGAGALPDDVRESAFAVASRADSMLALTGDKQFLISVSGDAFIMYRVEGRTWTVMGDPVGPEAAWPELVWRLREECDRSHGRLCFYQASEELLPLLVELGLQVMKYGEEALVEPARFTLEGSAMRKMRNSIRRAEAAGLTFEIIPAADVPAIGPELKHVSDIWLAEKNGNEKRFSLGRFEPEYLRHFDMAVLRDSTRIVAFANLWQPPSRTELSIDLMRHLPDAPYGTMDYLIVQLIQWAGEQGYAAFNLGMAPLSGLNGKRLAPFWSRMGNALFGRAEALYGFAGLRSYKAKFQPIWVPRYIATPSGLGSARALIDCVRLIGGGD